jgi:hypothetical protein
MRYSLEYPMEYIHVRPALRRAGQRRKHGAGPAVLSELTVTEDITARRLTCVPVAGAHAVTFLPF